MKDVSVVLFCQYYIDPIAKCLLDVKFMVSSPLAKYTNQSFSYADMYTIKQRQIPPIYISDHKVTVWTIRALFNSVTCMLKD